VGAMSRSTEELLAGASFDDETFEGLNLAEANLGEKELCDCVVKHAKLQKSRWKRARLEDCVFDGCDLTGLDPTQLALRGVEFKHCKMLGIDWSNASTHPVMTFTDCNLSYDTFISMQLKKLRFVRCVLVEATFAQTDLTQAVFEDCQLAGARFESCNLERASFSGARGLLLDPARNRVRGASIPVEAAVALADSFGLNVIGFSSSSDE
jgi:fluoroquinolone resistance protein